MSTSIAMAMYLKSLLVAIVFLSPTIIPVIDEEISFGIDKVIYIYLLWFDFFRFRLSALVTI